MRPARSRLRGLAAAVSLLGALLVASPRAARAAPSDAAATATALASKAKAKRFALVIGSNRSLDKKQAPLRYADDDAAKIAALLEDAAVEVTLLTTLDRDSQADFPDRAGATQAATKAALRSAWAAMQSRMQDARDDGAGVELLIYYSGHGDVGPDGQGFLTLDDGKFTRADLFGEILAGSIAQHNHILIDACRSEQFVLSRGANRWKSDQAQGGYGEAVRRYLDEHQLGAFPNTGVILAHSVDQQTHEWERYRGGIFTHELVSGLRGGADINGDGHIEYSELGAFVAAANSSVDDPRARLQVVVRPPADDERRPLLVHAPLLGKRTLLLTDELSDLWSIEDARGVRIADLRRSGERPGYLRLPAGELYVARERPGDEGTVREETTLEAERDGVILGSMLAFSPSTRAARGAVDRALRSGLFATPFGPGYYAGYTDRMGILGVRDPSWREKEWEAALAADAAKNPAAPPQPPPTTTAPVAKVEAGGAPPPVTKPERSEVKEKGRPWAGMGIGTIVSPFGASGRIPVDGVSRMITNSFTGDIGNGDARALRGFDVRWQLFTVGPENKFPRAVVHFRSGYSAGRAELTRAMTTDGQATALRYGNVPLFVGANFYPFANFPVRPYLGFGAGFDILRLAYRRQASEALVDVSARLGFALHAGFEARITNYVAITAEVMQQWSMRRRLGGVPDLSLEGFGITTGVSVAIPVRLGRRRSSHATR
jgi:hypothetical protein